MAAGTPVVASGIDGYRNVATDGIDALLPPPGDVDALVAALGEVLRDGALAGALRANGARRAGDFAMTTLADEYVRIYRELIADAAATAAPLRRRWWRRCADPARRDVRSLRTRWAHTA